MNVFSFSLKVNRLLSGSFLAKALSTEIVMLRYALFAWRTKPEYKANQMIFTMHRKTGFVGLGIAILFVCLLESILVHLLVMQYNPAVAAGLTALSLYALIFLIAHINAVRRQPLLIDDNRLIVRIGIIWRASIALDTIRDMTTQQTINSSTDSVNLAKPLLSAPNVLLELEEPIRLEGVYGINRTTRRLALYVDDPNLLRFGLMIR